MWIRFIIFYYFFVVVVASIIILFYFFQEHFQVCLKYPQACEKCGQENTPRDMVNCFSLFLANVPKFQHSRRN